MTVIAIDTKTLPLPVETDTPIKLQFSSPTKLFAAMLAKDLFGDWVVMQVWGSKFTRNSGRMSIPVKSVAEGIEVLKDIAKSREKHGYALLP
ncbi:MAG: hypothetical protein HYS18_09860 [Burkholderiales bacterium]|nr:hypothetical protein [Burkholderiales bacterium]